MESRKDKAYVTWGIIVVNVVYFLFLDLTGSSENGMYMLTHGAMYVPFVLRGEYFRLLTSIFMHFGISHLVNNMLILFVLGDYMERVMGKIKYLLFYLCCGVGANLAELGWYFFLLRRNIDSPQAVSAGASGAIFGIAGGLLYIVIANRGRLEDLTSQRMAAMIILSLYLGFRSVETDNLAHVAGVVIGFVLSVFFYRRPGRS